jgi:hypothetical protein
MKRCPRSIDQPVGATGVMPRQPLVQRSPTDVVASSQLGNREETAQVILDESHSFQHRTGLLPRHGLPPSPRRKCYPCPRSVLLPMSPVCTGAAPDFEPRVAAARVRYHFACGSKPVSFEPLAGHENDRTCCSLVLHRAPRRRRDARHLGALGHYFDIWPRATVANRPSCWR